MAEQTRLQFLLEETMGRGEWGGAWNHCEQTTKCFMPTWFIFTPYKQLANGVRWEPVAGEGWLRSKSYREL